MGAFHDGCFWPFFWPVLLLATFWRLKKGQKKPDKMDVMKHLFRLGFFWTTLFLAQAFFGPLLLALFPKPGKGPKKRTKSSESISWRLLLALFWPSLLLATFWLFKTGQKKRTKRSLTRLLLAFFTNFEKGQKKPGPKEARAKNSRHETLPLIF